MEPQPSAHQSKVTLGLVTMDTCAARGKPVRAHVEVGGEAHVMTTATPHSTILFHGGNQHNAGKTRASVVGNSRRVLEETTLPSTPGHDMEGMDVRIVEMAERTMLEDFRWSVSEVGDV